MKAQDLIMLVRLDNDVFFLHCDLSEGVVLEYLCWRLVVTTGSDLAAASHFFSFSVVLIMCILII
jgi:hypothetical protein